jgi:hypothetical protein
MMIIKRRLGHFLGEVEISVLDLASGNASKQTLRSQVTNI